MSLVPFAALVRRDVRLILTDRRALVLTLAVPVALASLIGTVFAGPALGTVSAGGDRGSAYDGHAHAFAGMAIQFVLFMGLESGIWLVNERRRGVWDRLRASSVSLGTLLVSRAVSGTLLAVLVMAVVFGSGAIVFGVRIHGSALGFAGALVATAAMASCFGLAVAAIGRTPEATRGLGLFLVLLLTMLGGAWFPAFLFPGWMQRLTLALPTRWAMDAFDDVTWRGLSLASVAPAIAVLAAFTAGFAAVARLRFRWE